MISRPYKALYVNAAGKDCGFFPWEWTANGCDTAKDAAVAIQTAPGALLGGYNPNDKPHISKTVPPPSRIIKPKTQLGPVAKPAAPRAPPPPPKSEDIIDQINGAFEDAGLPANMAIPALAIGGVILLVLVLKR